MNDIKYDLCKGIKKICDTSPTIILSHCKGCDITRKPSRRTIANSLNLPEETVKGWFKKSKVPSWKTIEEIANRWEISIHSLLSGDIIPNNYDAQYLSSLLKISIEAVEKLYSLTKEESIVFSKLFIEDFFEHPMIYFYFGNIIEEPIIEHEMSIIQMLNVISTSTSKHISDITDDYLSHVVFSCRIAEEFRNRINQPITDCSSEYFFEFSDYKISFPDRLKQIISASEYSRQEFADFLGVKKSTLQNWIQRKEKPYIYPSISIVNILCNKFNIDIEFLFGNTSLLSIKHQYIQSHLSLTEKAIIKIMNYNDGEVKALERFICSTSFKGLLENCVAKAKEETCVPLTASKVFEYWDGMDDCMEFYIGTQTFTGKYSVRAINCMCDILKEINIVERIINTSEPIHSKLIDEVHWITEQFSIE